MKKVFAGIFAAMIALASLTCMAQEYAEVKINGEVMNFDVPAQIINDRTMVPMRKIFERFGADVEWVEDDEMIVATTENGKIVIMKIGSPNLFIKQENEEDFTRVDFDVAPMIADGRTLVPLRVVSESFGYSVDWNEETSTVLINE